MTACGANKRKEGWLLFTGLTFICLFLPLTVMIYWALPARMRQRAFLIISILFLLITDIRSAAGMGVLTALTVTYGRMSGTLRKKRIQFLLWTALLTALYLLGFAFWSIYLYLELEQMQSFLRYCPFGAAFFVLQGLGYVADVYTGKISGTEGRLRTAEYLLFYPRLVMGPVQSFERHMLMQQEAVMCSENLGEGLGRFIRGLAKKALLADTIGLVFSSLYGNAQRDTSLVMAWVTLLAFVLQLYFTVAGYADMAKGIGLCFGFRLPDSYGYPIFSGSLAQFGERWNMSVVKWCRSCFTPMLRPERWQCVLGTVCVWAILGCWYRPCVQMLLWGIWMGFWIGLDQFVKTRFRKAPAAIEAVLFVLTTFSGWAVFSAPTLMDGLRSLTLLFGSSGSFIRESDLYFLQSGGLILLIAFYSATGHFAKMMKYAARRPVLSKGIGILALPVQAVLLILCLAVLATQNHAAVLL